MIMRHVPPVPLPLLCALLVVTAAPGRGATPGAAPGASLSPRQLRQVVARQVVRRPEIGALISHAPVLGGTWSVAAARDVRFVAPGVVALDYEDGHLAGRLVVRVVDALDPRTWVVLEDRER
jgi:hypothetical protein